MRYGLLLLLTLALSATGVAAQTTYYIAPDGSDDASGTSEGEALKTFDEAVDKLTTPGDELVLLDGTYTPEENGSIDINNLEGTETNPYVIRAQNERQAWIQGDGLNAPVDISRSSWIIVDGLRASSQDSANFDSDGDFDGNGSVAEADVSDHVMFRRLLVHNPNRYDNASVIGGSRSHHILVEECEVYNFHRHGISFHRGDQNVIRRSFVNAREYPTPEGHDPPYWTGHGCCREAGDEGFSFYFTSNSILENSFSMHTEQLSIIGGVATVLGNDGGQNNQVLGNISYKDLRPGGFLQSRRFVNSAEDRYGGYTDAADSIVYRDYLVVGGQDLDEGADFSWSVARNVLLESSTFINHDKEPPITAGAGTRGDASDPEEHRVFMGCEREEVDGCDYDIRNALFLDNAYNGDNAKLLDMEPSADVMNLLVSYSNAYSSTFTSAGFNVDEDATDEEGQYQNNMGSIQPTGMGLGQGECIVFVPESSNMSGAGADLDEDGTPDDIGANLLYRYEDGELTDEPLWDPETGEYPHGAVIAGSPNDPSVEGNDVVASNIHEKLNVNTNGCTLPYATGTATGEVGEVPSQVRLHQNYPNPFNPSTEIIFDLPQASAVVKLTVYDVLGREVATLVDGQQMGAGTHRVRFEAGELPSGMYVYRLEAGGRTQARRMMLVR